MHLRRLESKDALAPAIALAREFGDWATERIREEFGIVIPPEEDHPTDLLNELLEPECRLYVAEVGGEAVGVGGLKRLGAGVAEIKRMYVRPAARGLGVGRAIVDRAALTRGASSRAPTTMSRCSCDSSFTRRDAC